MGGDIEAIRRLRSGQVAQFKFGAWEQITEHEALKAWRGKFTRNGVGNLEPPHAKCDAGVEQAARKNSRAQLKP
jgi:hypothetical protein